MGAFIPKWRPLDAINSARLLSARPDEGGVAALCVSPALAGTTEGATLAIELAGGWAAAGLRVLLADGTVGTPSLHVPFGLPNEGGLADVLLAGNEWERLTLTTGTPGLRLLPAGGGSGSTAPQDALQQLAQLCADTKAEGTLLVFFVPLGSMVTEWVFGECTDIVVLSTEGENLQPFFDQDEDRIRALLGRPEGWQAPSAPSGSAMEAATDEPPARASVQSAPRPRPQPSKNAPTPGESEPGASPARPERRGTSLPGSPPPTARIEEAWAKAAAQLRASMGDDPEAIDDLVAGETPPAAPPLVQPRKAKSDPAPPPEAAVNPTPTAEDKSPAAPPPAVETPPKSEPVAKAPPRAKPAAKAPPVAPAAASPAAPKASKPRSPAKATLDKDLPTPRTASPSPTKSSQPPPPAWTPADTTPLPLFEEPAQPFAEPDLPPPLPLLESWDPEFGADEAYDRARSARWRRHGRNGLLALAGVALVAVVVVVRNAGRSMPPLETPVTPFPQARVDAEDPAEAAVASEEGSGDPDDQTSGPGEETPAQVEEGGAAPAVTPAATAAPPTQTPTPTPASATAAPGAPHQRFSWSIAALGTFRAARNLAERMGRAAPDQAFMVAPIVSNGRTLYRVLGGLSEDRPGLVAQRGSLGEPAGSDPSKWFVREAPSAFLLDEFDDQAAAQTRAQALWSAGIPVYVLVVNRQDGSEGHRVYAGAYGTEQEAEPLLAMLREAGITGMTFTERRGRVAR